MYLFLTLRIGVEREDGAEYFDLKVVDTKYLSSLSEDDSAPVMGKELMIIKDYNPDAIIKKIKECVAGCSAENWEAIALNLSRYFDWEFENYQPDISES